MNRVIILLLLISGKIMKNSAIQICDATIQPGEKTTLALPLPEQYSCSPLYMPIKVINGKKKGPCLLLFSMIILSTVFTIKTNYTFNNFLYAFFGVLTGIIVYFLADLSIAFGKSGKIPLVLSVWMPVILIMTFSTYSLLRSDE